MKIYTSYFAKYKQLIETGIFPVSISRYPPKFITDNNYPTWLTVAPSESILRQIKSSSHTEEDKRIYTQRYITEVLGQYEKNPLILLHQLLMLVPPGTEAVALCCFEKPDGSFCHRHLLSQWLNTHIPEISPVIEYIFPTTNKNESLLKENALF